MDSELNDKINDLFSESDAEKSKFEELTASDSTFAMDDFTEEEKKEVASYLNHLHKQLPKKPKKVWKWHFGGRLVLKLLIFLIEFFILAFLFSFVLPYSINIDMNVTQGTGLAIVFAYVKYWFS